MTLLRRRSRLSTPARLATLLLAPALCACATYPQRSAEALSAFERGDLEAARLGFSKASDSAFLRGAEAGMVALTAGDWKQAQLELDAAAEAAKGIEDRALISATDLGEGLLTWMLNEGARSYHGEGFERVMLHASLAVTYLARGDAEGVLVEAKRANALLEREEELYQKQYRAGGLGHFVSAMAYELLGEPDNAYIDYERMVHKDVGTEIAGRALVRLSSRLRYGDELARWEERFGPDSERPEDAASIVLIGGVGLAPVKQEITLPIPTPDGLLQWSVPSFVARPQPVTGLVLREVESGAAVRASVLERAGEVARANLEDRIAWLAAKSAVRAVIKRELTQHLEREFDLLGRIAGDVFTFVTERADLRSWLTLPDSWHAARLFVAPGTHTLTLEADGGPTRELGCFELAPGETMFVFARTVGPLLHAHTIGGLAVEPTSASHPAGEAGEPVP